MLRAQEGTRASGYGHRRLNGRGALWEWSMHRGSMLKNTCPGILHDQGGASTSKAMSKGEYTGLLDPEGPHVWLSCEGRYLYRGYFKSHAHTSQIGR